ELRPALWVARRLCHQPAHERAALVPRGFRLEKFFEIRPGEIPRGLLLSLHLRPPLQEIARCAGRSLCRVAESRNCAGGGRTRTSTDEQRRNTDEKARVVLGLCPCRSLSVRGGPRSGILLAMKNPEEEPWTC